MALTTIVSFLRKSMGLFMNIYQAKILLNKAAEKVVGKNNVEKLYFKSKYSLYTRSGVVFIHIPKSAGSSVCDRLYGKRVGHFTAAEILEYDTSNSLSDLHWVSVLRDPSSRLLSAYRYARMGGGSDGGIDRKAVYQSELFDSFERFVNEWLPFQNLEKLDRVFWPQSWFVKNNNILYENIHLSTVENIAGLSAYLKEKGLISRDISKKNVTAGQSGQIIGSEERSVIDNIYHEDVEIYSGISSN